MKFKNIIIGGMTASLFLFGMSAMANAKQLVDNDVRKILKFEQIQLDQPQDTPPPFEPPPGQPPVLPPDHPGLDEPPLGDVPQDHPPFDIQILVTGTVDRITGDMIFIETDEGIIREFSLEQTMEEGIHQLREGDRVVMEINESNQITDIRKIEEEDGLGVQAEFQLVTGEVVWIDPLKKAVMLLLNNGTSRTFQMKDAAATKMSGIAEGTMVMLRIDKKNNMVSDVELKFGDEG